MTVGHSKFLPLKIQPSEEIIGHNKFLPLKNSAKRGDDSTSQQIFTAENSAKRGDDSRSQQIFTAENSAKRGDDNVDDIGTFVYN